MSVARGILLGIAVIALGYVVCPVCPGKHRIDPDELLLDTLNTSQTAGFVARRTYSGSSFGRSISREVVVGDGVSASIPVIPDDRYSLLRENYVSLVEGEDTIAGRQVWSMRLRPNRKNFPWKQLWIDKRTHVVLASKDWSFRNKVNATMVTKRISYAELPLDAARMRPNPRRTSRMECPQGVIQPKYITSGFELYRVEVDNSDGSAHLVYSDGLYTLSIFVGGMAGEFVECMRPGVAYDWGRGLMIHTRVGDGRDAENVIVVGDLPVAEIEKVADSVR